MRLPVILGKLAKLARPGMQDPLCLSLGRCRAGDLVEFDAGNPGTRNDSAKDIEFSFRTFSSDVSLLCELVSNFGFRARIYLAVASTRCTSPSKSFKLIGFV
jgi:hypothetical protein